MFFCSAKIRGLFKLFLWKAKNVKICNNLKKSVNKCHLYLTPFICNVECCHKLNNASYSSSIIYWTSKCNSSISTVYFWTCIQERKNADRLYEHFFLTWVKVSTQRPLPPLGCLLGVFQISLGASIKTLVPYLKHKCKFGQRVLGFDC